MSRTADKKPMNFLKGTTSNKKTTMVQLFQKREDLRTNGRQKNVIHIVMVHQKSFADHCTEEINCPCSTDGQLLDFQPRPPFRPILVRETDVAFKQNLSPPHPTALRNFPP
jgi:hypothetical protein